jgi:hypothetical protein
LSERLVQIIPAEQGYRMVLIARTKPRASWSVKPVVAWGLFADDEHDLEGRPGHWERVTALWQEDDRSFPNLTWERDDESYSPVWLLLGPGDQPPGNEEIAEEGRKRYEAWRKESRLREQQWGEPAAVLSRAREDRDRCAKMLADAEERLRRAERDAGA